MAVYENYIDDAQKLEDRTGIPASVTLAQMTLESTGSGGGLSSLAKRANNLFGMKGEGDAGTVSMPTKEWINGEYVTTTESFAKYSSPFASMQDYAELLESDRYRPHIQGATTVEDFVKGIKAGGYATDPSYVDKVLNVISSYGLDKYDSGRVMYTGEGSENGSTPEGNSGGILFTTFRAGLIVILLVAGIIFFMRAFPATKAVTDLVNPAKKVQQAAGVVKNVSRK